jgi:hypothetical protein
MRQAMKEDYDVDMNDEEEFMTAGAEFTGVEVAAAVRRQRVRRGSDESIPDASDTGGMTRC